MWRIALLRGLEGTGPLIVLLPPSAGKADDAAGPPVDLAALAYADVLAKPRDRLLRALRLTEAPTAPAADIYTGVLFAQLRLKDLADRWDRVLIASALFGVVAPGDPICAYKIDMGSKVPRLKESLAAFWRKPLARALPDAPGLVIDMRSGSYAAAWKPRHATVLGVRGFTLQPDGSRKVITHMAKRVRGDVARLVLEAGDAASSEDVLEIARAGGLRAELNAGYLDVLE